MEERCIKLTAQQEATLLVTAVWRAAITDFLSKLPQVPRRKGMENRKRSRARCHLDATRVATLRAWLCRRWQRFSCRDLPRIRPNCSALTTFKKMTAKLTAEPTNNDGRGRTTGGYDSLLDRNTRTTKTADGHYTTDSKTADRKVVWVRLPPSAPEFSACT